jgi:sigma-B regulation protein RsbU (phosphoserine phosphatase)
VTRKIEPGGLPFHGARKQLEERLFLFSRAIQQSPNALVIARVDGVIEYVNPSFTRLTGYASEEVIGEHPSWQVFENRLGDQYWGLGHALRAGRVWQGEIQDRRKDGEPYWALESITPIADAEGNTTHFLVIRQDITQEKRNLQALAISEARFRQVAEMSGEWLWEQDPSGRYTYSSGAVTNILGYTPEEIIGHSFLEFTRHEDLPRREREMVEPVEGHRPFRHLVNRYVHRDGYEVYTESTGKPVFDEDGRMIKWLGVDHDITARKRYEDALRLRDQAIEEASVGIVIADARKKDTPNIYVNAAAARITGYPREELIGRNMRLLQGPETDPKALEEIRDALQQGQDCVMVLRNYRKNGEPFWNELLISPVRDEDGTVRHFIGILADVTERRRAQEERRELEIARQIQLALLPAMPLRREGIWVAGTCVSAHQVGGDYFDYYPAGDAVDVVIADVSGHSVGAALIMAEARSTLRAETRRTMTGPATLLSDLNELLFDDLDGADLFITLFYLRFDTGTRELRYANAGHNPPLLLRADFDGCEILDADGLVLGVNRRVTFEEKSVLLNRGDRILLYTDGITEARNERGEFFGPQRLCDLFRGYRHDPPQAVVDKLLGELCAFCGDTACEDDVTLVVLVVL